MIETDLRWLNYFKFSSGENKIDSNTLFSCVSVRVKLQSPRQNKFYYKRKKKNTLNCDKIENC